MKKIALVLLAALLALATACTQYVFIPSDLMPGYGGDGSSASDNEADTATIINYLQSDGFLQKITAGGETGLSVATSVGAEAPTVSASAKTARAAGDHYWATVTFTMFSDADAGIFIEKGSVVIEFKGVETTTGLTITSADVDVTEELSYTANGRTGTFEMSYTDGPASGTITTTTGSTTFTVEALTMSTPGNATITTNGDSVSMGDVGESITNGFGGGSGTPEDPYLIYNAEQFMQIQTLSPRMLNDPKGVFYFEVMDDIEFTEDMPSPAIGVFRGDIDFNGHTMSGLTMDLLRKDLSELQLSCMKEDAPNGLIENYLEGTISNLEYRPSSIVPLIYMTHNRATDLITTDMVAQGVYKFDSTVTIRNVTAYGDFDEPEVSNASLFIGFAFYGNTVFDNCKNYASINSKYGSAFLGGYPWYPQESDGETRYSYVTFQNCINYGNISGTNVGVFIGNPSAHGYAAQAGFPVITVKDCSNEGVITGAISVGYYAPVSDGQADFTDATWLDKSTLSTNTGNDQEHIILLAEPTGLDVNENTDGTFTITNSNPDYASFSMRGSAYGTLYSDQAESIGTKLTFVREEGIECASGSSVTTNIKKLQMIDKRHSDVAAILDTVTKDEAGNDIITVGDTTYFFNDSEATHAYVGGSTYIATLTWTITCYDENGYTIGQMNI